MIKKQCSPDEIAVKSLFLGPQSENSEWVLEQVQVLFTRWFEWRRQVYPSDGVCISHEDQTLLEFRAQQEQAHQALLLAASRFEKEVPKFSPRYLGHMFSEISLPALFGHILTLLHNPNNISGESSRVGVQLEDEAIGMLAQMLGYNNNPEGHFTSGGTVANFEALVRARSRLSMWLAAGVYNGSQNLFASAHMGWQRYQEHSKKWNEQDHQLVLNYDFEECGLLSASRVLEAEKDLKFNGPVVLVPQNKHYSWIKGTHLLGLGAEAFWPVQLNKMGQLDITSLHEQIERARSLERPILLVVSVVGTTEMGTIDPVDQVNQLLDDYRARGVHIWHHVDAAYGGFFATLKNRSTSSLSEAARLALQALGRSDSITIDPHKLGYVPYSSGAFLTRDKADYHVRAFDAPYLQYNSKKDRGPFTIEGSRSAAGAVATWMSGQTLPFNEEGWGRVIERTIRMRTQLQQALRASGLPVLLTPHAQSNVLTFAIGKAGDKVSYSNTLTERVYETLSVSSGEDFVVSKTTLHTKTYKNYLNESWQSWKLHADTDHQNLVRMCLMNPFFDSKEMKTEFSKEFIQTLRRLIG